MSIIIHNNEFNLDKYPFNLYDAIDKYLDEDRISDLFIILPTAKWQRRLKNEIITKYYSKYQKPLSNLNIYNLSDFVKFIFYKFIANSKYIFMSDAYKLAIFEEAINNSTLKFYNKNNSNFSYSLINRLAQTIYGLKEDGITIESITKDLENHDNKDIVYDRDRLRDILEIYTKYQDLLDSSLIDFADMMRIVTIQLNDINLHNPNNIRELIFKNKNVCILAYGFTDFKLPEVEFFSKFGYTNIPFAINLDFSIKNGPLCGNIHEIINWLEATQKFKKFEDESQIFDNRSDLEYNDFLKKYLFANKKIEKSSKMNKFTSIFELSDFNTEVRFISKLIKKLVLEDKINIANIAIASRNPSEYSVAFRNIFQMEQIPHNISDRFELKSSPIIIFVFKILEYITNNKNRESFLQIIKNPFFRFKYDKNYNLNNLIKVISNFKYSNRTWEHLFRSKIQYLENSIKQLNETNPDSIELYHIQIELDSVIKAFADFESIDKIIPQGNKYFSLNISTFINLIKNDIIAKFGLFDRILYIHNQLYETNNIENIEFIFNENQKQSIAISKFIEVLNELEYITDKLYNYKLFKIDYLLEKLKTIISAEKYNIKEKFNYGIEVTSIEQLRGKEYQVLILCGAYENGFPSSFGTDTFIGKEIPDSKKRHYNSEQIQFYQFLTNNSFHYNDNERKIYITYPKSKQNNELVQSHFIKELFKITNLEDNCFFKINNEQEIFTHPWIYYLTNQIEIEEYSYLTGNLTPHLTNYPYLTYISSNDFLLNNYQIKFLNSEVINKVNIDNSKPMSISDIERYNVCPYKYFVYNILGLRETIEFEKDISPLEKGNLIHYILFTFYNIIKNREDLTIKRNYSINENHFELIEFNLNKKNEIYNFFINIAHNCVKESVAFYPFFNLYYKELIGLKYNENIEFIPPLESNRSKLIKWLKYQLNRQENNWGFYPFKFEFSFGFRNQNTPIIINEKLAIKGKIDRLEIKVDDNKIQLLIADYKSKLSNNHTYNAIFNGKSFQMPLYAKAMNIYFEKNYKVSNEISAAVYYPTEKFYYKDKETDYKVVMQNDNFTYNKDEQNSKTNQLEPIELIEISETYAIDIINNINNGKFNIEPNYSICQYCNYQEICKKNNINK